MDFNFEQRYERHSGQVPIEGADPGKVLKARIWNFIEPIAIYAAILIVVWVSMLDTSQIWMLVTLGGMLLWILIFSPMVHFMYEKDVFLPPERRNLWFYFFECRGMGSPKKYFFGDIERPVIKSRKALKAKKKAGEEIASSKTPLWKRKKKTILILLILFAIQFSFAIVGYWPEYMDILDDAGLPATAAVGIPVGIGLIALVLLALFAGFSLLIRFDTLKRAAKQLIIMISIGIPLILVFCVIFIYNPELPYFPQPQGSETVLDKFGEWEFFRYIAQWTGYVWWGYVQQLLFLSYFSIHFTRAFDIRTKRGQLLAALCSSIFFGLIHLPTFWLSFFTWVAGFMWALFFMKSKNLFVMGVCHGAMGTLLNQLTPIKFSVGPTSI